MKLAGFDLFDGTMDELQKQLHNAIETKRNCFVITPNPEILGYALTHSEFHRIIESADIRIPDGSSILWLSRLLRIPITQRLTGIDTATTLLAAPFSKKVFLLGASPNSVQQAVETLRKNYPFVSVVGYHNGYFKNDQIKTIIQQINDSHAEILFIGMGAPYQEQFVSQNLSRLTPYVKLCIGGTFDVWAGSIKRSPVWMQSIGLEWLFRLYKDPKRWKRILKIPVHLYRIGKKELTSQ